MKILGLHINADQTAACVLVDGVVTAAAAEERFSRIKRDRAFPKRAIDYCLKERRIDSLGELDAIAVSWNPAIHMRNINMSGFTSWRRYEPEWLYIVPNNLMDTFGSEPFAEEALKMELGLGTKCPLYFVEHHLSHVAHAVYHSSFERGAFAVVDEYGEFYSVTLGRFEGDEIKIIRRIPYPHSLGVFYAAMTEYLGFKPNYDEWKVMGAAAYGRAEAFEEKVSQLLVWDDNERGWVLSQRYIEHANLKRAGYLNERLVRLLGVEPRKPGAEMSQVHYDLAAGAQAVFEKRLFRLLGSLAEETGEENLAASGGCFMNSLANGKIILKTPFKRLFIPYAAADNGGAMGAALWTYRRITGRRPDLSNTAPTPFLGPSFDDNAIRILLNRYKLSFNECSAPAVAAARDIDSGKLVGWFSGRMEFGERALGARSILADPRVPGMKDKINKSVKYREDFRPFAASVLKDCANRWFKFPEGMDVPYMERVYSVREEKKCEIPAVVHGDGTCRVHTVSAEENPQFYRLITEFERLTGVGLVLNTSFNVQGEPIVCSPEDALRTFFTCGLEVLYLEGCVLRK